MSSVVVTETLFLITEFSFGPHLVTQIEILLVQLLRARIASRNRELHNNFRL